MTADRRVVPETRLVEAVRSGRPLPACSQLTPEQLARSNDEQHIIPARVIRDLLLAEEKLDPRGVQVTAARITETLDLDGVECKVGLKLVKCWFDEPMTARGAKLPWLWMSESHLPGLHADGLQTVGNVDLNLVHVRGHHEVGAVQLRGANIGGHLLCPGAQLCNDTGPALNAEAMQVKGTVFFRKGFRATGHGEDGAVRLASAHIVGRLSGTGAQIANHAGPALHAARLQVDSSVQLSGLSATGHGTDGAVRLRSARIGGRLWLRGAQLANQAGPALHAARLESDGSAHLRGLRATGKGDHSAVLLRGAIIRGNLLCPGAQLHNDTGPALDARAIQVGEAALLRDGFHATGHGDHGAVRLRGARIGTNLEFDKGVHNPDGPTLDLRSAMVTQLSLPKEAVDSAAEEDPRGQATDKRLLLDGLTYATIPRNADLTQWLDWLRRCTPYAAQPYQQLAAVHRAVGEEASARRILIAQQDDLRARGDLGGRWAKARHWLLGLTIGYGYRTWRAFIGLAAVLTLAVGLGLLAGHIHGGNRWVAAHTDRAGSATAGTGCSTVEQVGLGVERAIPLLITNTRVSDRCALDSDSVPGQLITATGWILQLAAWALATLAIAGYTGLVRKT